MELTIKEALKTAVERHKVGKLKEAEGLYRSILKTQPKHPDANHNLGVLAISLGKVREGLPFLRLALNTSPEQGQFWISYIDALIKIGQFENANEVLLKGKDSGLKGDKVDQLEAKLNSKTDLSSLSVRTINSQKEQIVVLHSEGKLNEALSQANIVADNFLIAI